MKKNIGRSLVIMCILLAVGTGSFAQRLQMQAAYSINTPTGTFRDVIKNTSFKGFTGGVTYMLNTQWNVGLGISYNDYYEKFPRQVYHTGEGELSAVVSNSIQTIPVVVKATYAIVHDGIIRPYVGAGAGLNLINFDQYLGEYPTSKVSFKPAVQAEAGVHIPLGVSKSAGITLGGQFNYLPYKMNGIQSLNNWGVHAGVFFPLK